MNSRTCLSGAACAAAPWLFRAGRGALFAVALGALLLPRSARAGEDRRVRQARILFKSGKYHEAIKKLRTVIEADPRNTEAYLWLGKAYNHISEPARAVESLEKAREIDPDTEEVYRVLGLSYLDLMSRARAKGETNLTSRHLDHAKKLGKELLRRRPKDKESYEFLITLAKSQKKFDEAIHYCEEVLKIDPNDVSTHLDLIDILVAQKKLDTAERRCKELLRISPTLHAPRLVLARIYELRDDIEGAVEQLTKIIERRKTHREARLRRAEIYIRTQQYEKALEDADAVARVNEQDPYAHFIRGYVFMQLKKISDAIDEFQRAVADPRMRKQHFASHFLLARCLLVKGKNIEAIESLNYAVAIRPDFTPARLILASTHLQQGYYDGAIEVLSAALGNDPDNTEILRLLGVATLHKGDYAKSHTYFQRMLDLDPQSTRANQILAGMKLAKGKVDEAIGHCLKALESEPQNIDIHFLLGLAYLQKRRLGGAESQFHRVLELRDHHPGARINLAKVHLLRRQFGLAEEQLRRCIREDPGLPAPRYQLATLLAMQKKYDEAQEQLDEALKVERNKSRALTAIAELHRRRGNRDEAITSARRALTEDPKYLRAHLLIAAIYRADQNWGAALQELTDALKKNPRFAPGYEAAVIHMHLGQYRDAIAVFNRGLRYGLEPRRTHMGLAAANQLLGDYQAARANMSLAERQGRPVAVVLLLTASVYIASGDTVSARAILKKAPNDVVPKHLRDAFLALLDKFVDDRPRIKQIADAITNLIFYASRGPAWSKEAERSAGPLIRSAPNNTFVYDILANVYLLTRDEEKYLETIQRLIKLAPKAPRYYIRLAGVELNRGRFKEGRELLEKAAEMDPDSADARVALADYFRRTTQYELAIEQAEKALRTEEDNDAALQILARCYRATREFEKARKALSRLAEKLGGPAEDPVRAAATLLQLGDLDRSEGKPDQAIERYKQVLERIEKAKTATRQRLAAHLGLAAAYQQLRKVNDAITELKNALAIDSTNSTALFQLARIYRATGRLHIALATIERAATISPSVRAIRLELAAIHHAMEHHDLAIAEYKKILKDSPSDLRSRLSIAEIHFRRGDHATAIKQAANLLQDNPGLIFARSALVGFYKRLGDTDKALPHLEALVKATPQYLGAADLAVTYIHQGRLDDAAVLLDKAAQEQSPPLFVIAKAIAQQLDGQPAKAVETLAPLHKQNPNNGHFASLLANAQIAAGQAPQARKTLETIEFPESQLERRDAQLQLIDALKNPGDASRTIANTLNLAVLYADTGWLPLALQQYDKLPDSLQNNLAVLHLVANAHERLRDADKAIATYRRMLKAQIDYPFALARLAQHLARKNDYAGAEDAVRKLLKSDPRNVQRQIQLATLLQQQKKTEEAIQLYRRIMRQAPNQPIAYNNLAWIYAVETENFVEAEALAKRAVKLTTADSAEGGAARDTLGWIYFLTERYDEAMKLLQKAVRAMPGSAEVHYHLGMILFERKLRNSAARQLTLALKLDPEYKEKGKIDSVLDRIRRRLP